MTQQLPTPEELESLKERVRVLIKDRPYFICRVSDKHTELFGIGGRQINQYSRHEDRINEEYLEEQFLALLSTQRTKILEEVELMGPEDEELITQLPEDDPKRISYEGEIAGFKRANSYWREAITKLKGQPQ